MSSQDVGSISSLTGAFRALSTTRDESRPAIAGKGQPSSGEVLPVQQKRRPDMDDLARKLNIARQTIGRDLRFEVDIASGKSVIQVLDRDTGEVIRQIPPEKARLYVSETGDVALRLYDAEV